MPSPLFQAMSHRGFWIVVGLGVAAVVGMRQASQDRRRRAHQVAERRDDDPAVAWRDLAQLRAEEQLFDRFRTLVRKQVEVDVLDLLPEDEVGEVVETGRALCRLIDHLEGEFDCALPAGRATEPLTLEEWFRIVVRNAATRLS